MFWIIFLFPILYTRLPKFAHFVPRKKKKKKKDIKYYNWWIKKMKHCSTQGDRRFWLVCYIFTVPTLNCFFDFIIYYYYYYYFYVGVVGDLCSLENWYYRILILMTGFLQNATLAVDALSIWYVVLYFSSLPMFFFIFLLFFFLW